MLYRLSLSLFALFFFSSALYAEPETAAVPPAKQLEEIQPQEPGVAEHLQDILSTLQEKQKELLVLQRQLRQAKDDAEKQMLRLQQEDLLRAINKQKLSFEQVAVGGLDLTLLNEQPAPEFDWKKELVLVSKPLLDSLKEITEKPRKIEQLRAEMAHLSQLRELASQARQNIQTLQQQEQFKDTLQKQLQELDAQWQKRGADAENALGVARYQLAKLQESEVAPQVAIFTTLRDFLQGRGVTLLIAAIAVLGVWALMRLLLALLLRIYRWKTRNRELRKRRLRWTRLFNYAFWSLTSLLGLFAAITVFYSRNDVLLLMLTILGVLMLLLNLRTALPRYLNEIRLLLDAGPVRQDERVVYEGVPYQVRGLSVFSILVNPELDGIRRLPSEVLNGLVSRPLTDEPWFPCRPGDFIMLEDNRFAEVVKQSVETVQLRIAASLVTFPTAQFLQAPVRNLSREGFAVVMTFGVDYQHQAICLTEIPDRLRQALEARLAESEWAAVTELALVEFKEAGASSLDYIIVVKGQGSMAGDYFALGRLVQRTCVEVCNAQGWGIPFNQLTVHAGEGFAALGQVPQGGA